MAQVRLVDVEKRWGDVVGVARQSLDIADGEFLVLLGPSGCGKTTRALHELLPSGQVGTPQQDSARIAQTVRDRLAANLQRPAIVHLVGHATTRAGKVLVLADYSNATSDPEKSWLDLDGLLDAFKGRPLAVLLLDLRPVAEIHPLGVTDEPVGQALHRLLSEREKAGNLGFCVITPAGPDEQAAWVPELGMSLFGFFARKGLEGHADGWNPPGRKDFKVSGSELFYYVQAQVSHFAARRLPIVAGSPALWSADRRIVARL